MTTRRIFLTTLLAAVPFSQALAGGKKTSVVDLSFHLQAEEGDNPKMVFSQLTSGKVIKFRKTSEANSRDIESFMPFPSRDGDGYGIQVKLKPGAALRVVAMTTNNSGRWLLSMVNGRTLDAVMIDKPVNDGMLVIWKGISEGELAELDKTYPRFGKSKPQGAGGDKKKKI